MLVICALADGRTHPLVSFSKFYVFSPMSFWLHHHHHRRRQMKNWMALDTHKCQFNANAWKAKLWNDLNDAVDDKRRLPLPLLLCYKNVLRRRRRRRRCRKYRAQGTPRAIAVKDLDDADDTMATEFHGFGVHCRHRHRFLSTFFLTSFRFYIIFMAHNYGRCAN